MSSMMKIEFTEDTEINGQPYDEGEIEEFPADSAQQIIAEGVAKEYEEDSGNDGGKQISIDTGGSSSSKSSSSGSSNGPEWSKSFGIGKNKMLAVNLWERDNGQWYGAEMVRQEQDDDGNWDTSGRVYLPNSRALLELSIALRELYFKQKELNK